MRLVTYYTPSHQNMCERFVLGRAYGFEEVRSTRCEQRCPTGSFKQQGWNECMLDKLDCLLSLPADGEPTLYVDSDVALMPGLREWAGSYIDLMPHDAIAYSDDVVQWCAGVMLFRSTAKTHAWWRLVADLTPIWNAPDQDVIHALRAQSADRKGSLPVPMHVMPGDVVSNWATVGNMSVWKGDAFDVPASCLAWHANWTVGVAAKEEMLRRVVCGETSTAAPVQA